MSMFSIRGDVNDAKISSLQFQILMETIGGGDLGSEEVGSLVKFDENGVVGLDELAEVADIGGEDEGQKMKELKAAFEVFVGEGEECITAESLKKMLGSLGKTKEEEECMQMILSFDLNGDGVLSFDEFKAMMMP